MQSHTISRKIKKVYVFECKLSRSLSDKSSRGISPLISIEKLEKDSANEQITK